MAVPTAETQNLVTETHSMGSDSAQGTTTSACITVYNIRGVFHRASGECFLCFTGKVKFGNSTFWNMPLIK